MIIVNLQHEIIGHLRIAPMDVRDGQRVVLPPSRRATLSAYTDYTPSVVTPLTGQGVMLNSQAVSSFGEIPRTSPHFEGLVDMGGNVTSYTDEMRNRRVTRVELMTVCVDADTAEQLFDMDEFDPI